MKKLLLLSGLVVGMTATAQSTTDSVNVNVNPTDTLFIEVDEFSTGTIATIGGADEDGTDTLSVTLSTSDFSVTPSTSGVTASNGDIGGLVPQVTLDYAVQDEYVFNTTITDAGGLSATAVTKVKVNPLPLGDISPDSVQVAENSAATSFALSVERTLPNGTQQTLTSGVQYEILTIDGAAYDPANDPFSISGADLNVGANFNYEVQDVYAVEIKATRGSTDTTDIVYVEITNVNEAPYKIYVK
jgi:hypothetical protein